MKKIQEVLTPSQFSQEIGSHYLNPAVQSRVHLRDPIVAGGTSDPEFRNFLIELKETLEKFNKACKSMQWHNIHFVIPGIRKPGELFPEKFENNKTKVKLEEPYNTLQQKVIDLLFKKGEAFKARLGYAAYENGLRHVFPNLRDTYAFGNKQQWEFDLIHPNNTEVGNGLIRIHSTQGIPQILKGSGLGYNLYLSFIHHSGHVCSSGNASEDARNVYAKLAISEHSVWFFTDNMYVMAISKTFSGEPEGRRLVTELIGKFVTRPGGRSYRNIDAWIEELGGSYHKIDLSLWNYILPYIKDHHRLAYDRGNEKYQNQIARVTQTNASDQVRKEQERQFAVEKFKRAQDLFKKDLLKGLKIYDTLNYKVVIDKIKEELIRYSLHVKQLRIPEPSNPNFHNIILTNYILGHALKEPKKYLDLETIDFRTYPEINDRKIKISDTGRAIFITGPTQQSIVRLSQEQFNHIESEILRVAGNRRIEHQQLLIR